MKHCSKILSAFILMSLISCSNKSEDKKDTRSPALILADLTTDSCLNFEKLYAQVNQSFNYISRQTTLDFTSNKKSNALEVAQFGTLEKQMTSFPYLREAKQSDCSKLSLQTAYGHQENYEIIESSPLHLRIRRLKARNDELLPIELMILLTSPQSAIVEVHGQLLTSRCTQTKKIDYKKTFSLRWARDLNDLSEVETLSHSYLSSIRQMSGLIIGSNEHDQVSISEINQVQKLLFTLFPASLCQE